ncbi:MAG: hypothetical protein GXP09_00125, partial [Gammaproteobacteria bacterium]|nr:hypothetical protein [Gammaproteobacteria bacterium]
DNGGNDNGGNDNGGNDNGGNDNGGNDNGGNDNGGNDNGGNDNGGNDNGDNDNGGNDNGDNDNGGNDNGDNDNGGNDNGCDLIASFHTSCSEPIGPGSTSGDFEVTEGSSRKGGPLPPLFCQVTPPNDCPEGSRCSDDNDNGDNDNDNGGNDNGGNDNGGNDNGGNDNGGNDNGGNDNGGNDNGGNDNASNHGGGNDNASNHDSGNDNGANDANTAGACDGKVTELTLQYVGAGTVNVKVDMKKGGTVANATVSTGDTFTVIGADKKGTLGTEITILVNGSLDSKIHTSCSVPIGPGLITSSGNFVVISGSSRNGGELPPL